LTNLYRFLLAAFVVAAHLWRDGSGALSNEAVFSFYVLSGYLMTLILNETYGFGYTNFIRFWSNRYLRLYPAYAIVLLVICLHIAFVGPLDVLFDQVRIPETPSEAAANIAILGLAGFTIKQMPTIKMIPNAWSLGIEMFCYLLLSLYFARTRARLYAMLLIGALIAALQMMVGLSKLNYDFQNHYGVVQAGIIPFAAGGLAYFYRDASILKFAPTKFSFLMVAWVANWLLTFPSDFHRFVSSLYVTVFINFFFVPMMFDFDAQRIEVRWIDLIGRITYSVFVAHILIGTLLALYFDRITPMSFSFFVMA
jgi:peptidoglycan/LPS O-acetylase OafA/YrhL